MTKNNSLRIGFLLLGIISVAVLGLLVIKTPAKAADLSQFQAGRIIDDDKFTDWNSMSAQQIQDFLNQKNSVCLKNFRSLSLIDDNGDGTVQDSTTEQYGPETMSAAELIAAAAKIYRISPKVILATLQKEQGLITRQDCPAWRYNTALGYGCPDTAPCDQSAYGFTRQIDYGTYHFRGFFDDSFNYVPFGTGNYNIQYNPDPSCGSSTVFIQNRATASLYSYTPYQPNAGALAAGYGEAPCGAYGNRNFFQYYTDWFGPTTGAGYSFVTAVNPPSTLLPNQISSVSITIKNSSGTTWYSDGNTPNGYRPTRLRMGNYTDTPFANINDPAWLGTRNQVKMVEPSVPSGSNATFTFTFRGPIGQVNNYMTWMAPVIDGVYAFPGIGMGWQVSSPAPNLSYQVISNTTPKTIDFGASSTAQLAIKNTGNATWYNDASGKGTVTRLVTSEGIYRASAFYDSADPAWLSNNQIRMTTATVAPGETGYFDYKWKAPTSGSYYPEKFTLALDGAAIMPGSIDLGTTVNDYSYAVESVDAPSTGIAPGDTYQLVVKLKNTGPRPWVNDSNAGAGRPLRLAVKNYGRTTYSTTRDSAWITPNQITMVEPTVNVGEVGTFTATLAAPYRAVDESLTLVPIIDGYKWLGESSQITNRRITTPAPVYWYSTTNATVNPPMNMSPGATASGTLVIKNEGNVVWRNDENVKLPVGALRVVTASPIYRNSPFSNQDSTWIGTKNQIRMVTPVVRPGETGTFNFSWTAPQTPGAYTEYFSLVVDGQTLLPYRGMGFYTKVQ